MSLMLAVGLRANKPKRNVGVIDAGGYFSLAIQKNGRAWGWGLNAVGQLGNNSAISKRTPVSVAGAAKTFCQISAGYSFSLAIAKNGRAWAWGINLDGQLGDNSIISKQTPVSVAGAAKTFCQISAGGGHALAIDKNGKGWGWGYNYNGQLGNNSYNSQTTPVSFFGGYTFCKIAAGGYFSLGISKQGRAFSWGANEFGQLGNNNDIGGAVPQSVLGAVKTFCQIAAADSHSLAIDKNGRAWGWGYNNNGQLGDNTITQRLTPVSVAGAAKTFCQISAGTFHSLAIDKNGRAWAWGRNNEGQLGDNSTISKRTPVSIAGAVKTFCQISAGQYHSLAIDKNGRAWGWAVNDYGELGDNSIVSKLTPVRVCNI
jgi:alpha-tubulin suppressor-like RCC1 family protein